MPVPAAASPAPPDAVYAKTDAGRAEVARRTLGLSGRQRGILIMVDGRRACSALAAVLPGGALAAVVEELLALGLIAPVAAGGAAAPDPRRAATTPAAVARLAAIKEQMTATAETYLGLMAAEVVRRIERAADERELQGVLGHWHMALQSSKHGKAVALARLEQVRAAFGTAAQA